VKSVRYVVESTRVGQRTDYEKLILDVETDGSITPEEGIVQAGQILRQHIDLFTDLGSKGEEAPKAETSASEIEVIREKLQLSIESLELSVRSQNSLKAANIKTVAELVSHTESELSNLRNFGDKSMSELREVVERSLGLRFGMDVNEYLNSEDH